jgi:hypothetical protein
MSYARGREDEEHNARHNTQHDTRHDTALRALGQMCGVGDESTLNFDLHLRS